MSALAPASLAFGLPLCIAPTLEVLADVFGAISALVIADSTHRILVARRLLHTNKQKNESKITTLKAQIKGLNASGGATASTLKERLAALEKSLVELAETDASTSAYEPKDLEQLMYGVWLFGGSFVLKLLFHVVTKA